MLNGHWMNAGSGHSEGIGSGTPRAGKHVAHSGRSGYDACVHVDSLSIFSEESHAEVIGATTVR